MQVAKFLKNKSNGDDSIGSLVRYNAVGHYKYGMAVVVSSKNSGQM
jgi:hypothetical protein